MWFGVIPRHIFVYPNIQFSPDSKIVGSPYICLGTTPNHIFGDIFLPNLKYRYKHFFFYYYYVNLLIFLLLIIYVGGNILFLFFYISLI